MVDKRSKWEQLKRKVQRKGLYGANLHNTSLTLWMLEDLETGINVNQERGSRSPGRLITLVRRMSTISYLVEKAYGKDKVLTTLTEREVLQLFNKLRSGELKGKTGRALKDIASIGETVVQFWNWWVTVSRKQGRTVTDITASLNTKNDYKPSWVFLGEDKIKELADACDHHAYKALVWFCIDSGVRPQELQKILVNDLSRDDKGQLWLNVRQEVAKKGSFGRKFKLLLSKTLVEQHLNNKEKRPSDRLFDKSNETAKKYLRKRAIKLWGSEAKTEARGYYKDISLYDLRHNSAVYWRQRAENSDKLNSFIYRFGWKDTGRAFYYDEYLGFQDTFSSDDTLSQPDASRLEENLKEEKTQREQLQTELASMREEMRQLQDAVEFNRLYEQLHRISNPIRSADGANREIDSEIDRIKPLLFQMIVDKRRKD